jgi:glycolate oxidase iron-sulfur subunit
LRERKLGTIARTSAEILATRNNGCITQLKVGAPMPIVHTVELLDWATGGPRPPALANFAMRAASKSAVRNGEQR